MSECKFAVEAFHAYIESIGLHGSCGTLGELKAFKAGAEWQRSQQGALKTKAAEPTEAVEVVATVTVSFDEGDEGSAIELCELHTLLDEGVTDLMTVDQHKRLMAAKDVDAVIVPRAIAERMAIDAAQYEHEHAVVHDNVQLWQQPGARLTLTVGDLRTVRALLGGAA